MCDSEPSQANYSPKTYAAIRQDKDRIALSSSGGVFAAVAEYVLLKTNWVVVGSTLDETVSANHIIVDNVVDLKNLYGSKYVQSETTGIYKRFKSYWMIANLSCFQELRVK